MQFYIKGTNDPITHESIVQAIGEFDRGQRPPYYNNWQTHQRLTNAVEYDGRYYPAKCLIQMVTGLSPSHDFHTKNAVDSLTKLEFSVVEKPNSSEDPSVQESVQEPSDTTETETGEKKTTGGKLDLVQRVLTIVATAVGIISGVVALIWRSK